MTPSHPDLTRRALAGSLQLFVVMAAILAGSAWSLRWWNGWAFLSTFAGCSIIVTAYLLKTDPALLERRLRAGPAAEREPRQKIIQTFTSLLFLALLVVPGLDYRFGWSHVPSGFVVLGHVLIVMAFSAMLVVFRANSFASGTIELATDQRLMDTGPYAIVRHPMYAGATPLFVGMPLALGSWWGLLIVVPMMVCIIARLIDEERFLSFHLAGYAAYCARVPWRLVPGVW